MTRDRLGRPTLCICRRELTQPKGAGRPRRFCSSACRYAARRRPVRARTCPACGDTVRQNTGPKPGRRKKFCTSTCANRAKNRRFYRRNRAKVKKRMRDAYSASPLGAVQRNQTWRMTKLILALAAGLAASACAPYPGSYQQNRTAYEFSPTYETPAGLVVSDPRHELDPAALDATAARVQRCLRDVALTDLEVQRGWCSAYAAPPIRPGVRVLVAPDWRVSACTGLQVFPCAMPDAACHAKGLRPTADCPCSCRGALQDAATKPTIVITPNLAALPWQLVILTLGCDQPQNLPQVAGCAA